MDILLIHQNFPGQYKHLGPALAARGDRVVALTPRVKEPTTWKGVRVLPYPIRRNSTKGVHPWVGDLETKVIRAEACYDAAIALRKRGFAPDVILAHHGWGEPMFLKDVWPGARLGLYCEFHYRADYPQTGFDPEFPVAAPDREPLRMRLRNLNNRIHAEIMDAGTSPTAYQADTFPEDMRSRITICHDGIDTVTVTPDAAATLDVGAGRVLSRADEVVTFINRNLEPYRGYHVFMRALPDLLRARPQAQVVILGGDEVSYGARPPGDKSWKQIFIDEVRGDVSDADWARVHFLGRVPYDRYLAMLRISRVHVYLTYPFVVSWSLMEAMAAECAILASDTAPVREVIEDGRTGVLTDFFDRAAMVEKLSALLDDPERRRALGAAARQDVIARYDLESVCLPRLLDWVDHLATLSPRLPG